MELSEMNSVASSMNQAKTAEAVQMAVLKKSIDIKAQGDAQLIQSASKVVSSNPPHLGVHIDTLA